MFVGIYRGVIIPGFLRWCRISSIDSMYGSAKTPHVQNGNVRVSSNPCTGSASSLLKDTYPKKKNRNPAEPKITGVQGETPRCVPGIMGVLLLEETIPVLGAEALKLGTSCA